MECCQLESNRIAIASTKLQILSSLSSFLIAGCADSTSKIVEMVLNHIFVVAGLVIFGFTIYALSARSRGVRKFSLFSVCFVGGNCIVYSRLEDIRAVVCSKDNWVVSFRLAIFG